MRKYCALYMKDRSPHYQKLCTRASHYGMSQKSTESQCNDKVSSWGHHIVDHGSPGTGEFNGVVFAIDSIVLSKAMILRLPHTQEG